MGFRRSLVRIQSPRLEGRLSPDDSRPFPLTESSLAATVSRGSFVNNRTGIDGTCTRLSAVGATVGATIRAAPFVPVARTDSPSAWSAAKRHVQSIFAETWSQAFELTAHR